MFSDTMHSLEKKTRLSSIFLSFSFEVTRYETENMIDQCSFLAKSLKLGEKFLTASKGL